MTVSIVTNNSWPATLPLPFVDYAGASQAPTLHSPTASGRIVSRRRWKSIYGVVRLVWKMTKAQYEAFLTFYSTSLGNGAAKFTIELLYPKNSGLNTWIVQFASDVEIAPIENSIWEVSAQVQIHTQTTLPDATPVLAQIFYVLDTSSDGLPLQQLFVQVDSSVGGTEAFNVQ